MERFSEELRFEDAAKIRDSINNLRHIWESQKVIAPELGDIDVIGFYGEGKETVFKIFFIRNGVMIGTKDFHLKDTVGITTGELFHNFIEQFYAKEIIPPDEIVLRQRPDEVKRLWQLGSKKKKGENLKIITRPKGKKLEILRMADENAMTTFKSKGEDGY